MRKASRRDLPFVLAQRLDGATTVSATMLLAARAGISVFVTGGESIGRIPSQAVIHHHHSIAIAFFLADLPEQDVGEASGQNS